MRRDDRRVGSGRVTAHALAAFLLAFIAGVAAASVIGWVFRDRIAGWLRR